jgi:hypothetical protein
MGLTSEGTPVIQFVDADGEPTWTAPETLPIAEAADEESDRSALQR